MEGGELFVSVRHATREDGERGGTWMSASRIANEPKNETLLAPFPLSMDRAIAYLSASYRHHIDICVVYMDWRICGRAVATTCYPVDARIETTSRM